MNNYIKIGYRIKDLRGKISQKKFAETLNIPFRTYQNYEYGKRIPPGPVLQRIAEMCHVTTDYILTGNEAALYRHVLDKKAELSQLENELCALNEQIAEKIPGYGNKIDDVSVRILILLKDMTEEDRREILRNLQEKKLLRELMEERKKLKETG